MLGPAFGACFTQEAAFNLPQGWAGRALSGRREVKRVGGRGPEHKHSEPGVWKPKGRQAVACLESQPAHGEVPGHSEPLPP